MQQRLSPVFIPLVIIHAPVVLAAFNKPDLNTLASLGCKLKFAIPPCTVMTSLGLGKSQTSSNKCKISAGSESKLSRTY